MKKNIFKILISLFILISWVFSQTVVRVAVPSYSEGTKPAFEKIIADFEKENPKIKVNLEVGSWASWQQKLQTDFFSKGNADIIFSTRAWVPNYVNENKIEPLNAYLKKNDLNQFPNSLLEASKVNGKLYSLPSVTSARNLYVNTDLIKQAGAKIPKTWDELKKTAKLVSEKTDAAGFGIHGKEVEMEKYFYYVLWNFGGSVLNNVVNGTKSALNSPQALKAARFYNDLIKNGYSQKNVTSYNREDLGELFKQGKLAMMITHGLLAEEIKKENHNVNFVQTDVPGTTRNVKGKTLGVIDSVHLSKNSKVKKEAVKFLLFSFKPQYQADWVGSANLLPVTKAAGRERVFSKPHLQAMILAVPNAKFNFINKHSNKIIDILKNELQAMYSGKKTPKRALNSAHQKINRVLKR